MSRLLLEYTLQEVAPGDALVKQIAYEFADLFEQYKNEGIILSEGEIGNTQLKSIFKDAAKVTQGKKIEKSEFRKAFDQGVKDGEAAAGATGKAIKGGVLATAQGAAKLNKKMDDLVKKYEGKEGVSKFNDKADKAMAKIGDKVRKVKGGDKALDILKKLGEWGKENPGKQAIVLGALAAVGGFMSGGAVPMIAVPIYKAITAGAAGDKVTTILAKAAKGAVLGGVAGALGDAIGNLVGDNVEISKPEMAEGKVVGSSKVAFMAGEEDMEPMTQMLSDMTEDEFKMSIARRIASSYDGMNGGMSEPMIQKIADNIVINGTYPDNMDSKFEGIIVRGNVYLTPEENIGWDKVVNKNDPFAPNGSLGNETTKWMEDNVEGFGDQDAQADAGDANSNDVESKKESGTAIVDNSPFGEPGSVSIEDVKSGKARPWEYVGSRLRELVQNGELKPDSGSIISVRYDIVDELKDQGVDVVGSELDRADEVANMYAYSDQPEADAAGDKGGDSDAGEKSSDKPENQFLKYDKINDINEVESKEDGMNHIKTLLQKEIEAGEHTDPGKINQRVFEIRKELGENDPFKTGNGRRKAEGMLKAFIKSVKQGGGKSSSMDGVDQDF